MALQQVLAGLMHHPDAGRAAAAREAAENHLRRAFEEVPFGPDRARIWSAAQEDVRAAVQSPE